ncbi:MAG TPA: 5'-methylthioadenosine/S-adenosylhomocysteine nucleosidase [Virgibacillus sp.]|nr:5'-methylthioadenosine/S-adenosylhomocysteine nucleosidase [Virgibacillus sp.]
MTIGIIGAMDEEIALLIENIEQKKYEKVAHCEFIQGQMCGIDVVLLKSGIGKVNAAMATTIMHERFHPEYVINTGSAGGYTSDLNVGDIVISEAVVQHDVDVTGFDYEYGQIPGMPTYFKADERLVDQVEFVIDSMQIAYRKGIIATGDMFMSDPKRVSFVKETFPDMVAMEMEAGAIAQVCYQYSIPFVIIRSLSDIAGKEAPMSFDAFLNVAAKHATEVIVAFVEQLKY